MNHRVVNAWVTSIQVSVVRPGSVSVVGYIEPRLVKGDNELGKLEVAPPGGHEVQLLPALPLDEEAGLAGVAGEAHDLSGGVGSPGGRSERSQGCFTLTVDGLC